MSDIKTRKVEAWKAINAAREMLERAEAEGVEPNVEESEAIDRALSEGTKLLTDNQRAESKARLGEMLDKLGEPDRPQVKGEETGAEKFTSTDVPASETEEYAREFKSYLRGEAASPRMVQVKVQNEGTTTAGGYTVPKDFIVKLVQPLADFAPMLGLTNVIDVASNIVTVPSVTAHGSAAWTAESAAFNESDETFGTLDITVYKATRLVKITEELLADSKFDLDGYLANEFGRSIGALVNTALTVGTGSSQPFGVVPRVAGGQVQQAPTGNTTSYPADSLFDVKYKVKAQYRNQNARWMMNDTSVKAVSKLKDTTNQYIWQPGLTAGAPDVLLGHPVVINPDVAVMAANAKSIVFGDLTYHWVCRRPDISVQRLNELYSANGQVGYRIFVRYGADLVDVNNPLAIGQNSAT